jgi:uncharacterized protein YbaR (Trm112 family)
MSQSTTICPECGHELIEEMLWTDEGANTVGRILGVLLCPSCDWWWPAKFGLLCKSPWSE